MAAATLRNEERIGLVVALGAHVALVAWLALWRPSPEPIELPAKVSVTLSEEIAPVATTPEPSADPAPDSAPQLGEAPPPPAPVAQPEPQPAPPQPVIRPEPQPRPVPKPVARPVQPPPRPVPRPVPSPRRDAIADMIAQRSPAVRPSSRPSSRPAAATPPRAAPSGRPGGTRFADAFNKGIPGASGAGQPAAASGAQKSTWTSLIGSKVQRFWNGCSVSGLDVEKLRVDVRFTLAKDGSIESMSEPVVPEDSITPANRAQVAPFKACATKAIKLAAPFTGLPSEYYKDWKLRALRLRKQ